MTLFRQLAFVFIGSLTLMTLSLITVYMADQREFIADQQEQQLKESLASLAIALKPLLTADDRFALDTLLSEYLANEELQGITLTHPNSSVIWQRSSISVHQNAPDWFSSLPLFSQPQHSVLIQSQWQPLARLELLGSTAQASDRLWTNILELLVTSLIITLLTCALLSVWLHYLMKPLKVICSQSEAIANYRHLPLIEVNASTIEFARLQRAFQIVGKHFNKLFDEQAEEAKRLQQRIYTDPLSGVGNRLLLQAQMERWIKDGSSGLLCLLSVPSLAIILDRRSETDYRNASQQLQQTLSLLVANPSLLSLVRLSNTEFALLITEVIEDELESLSHRIQQSLDQITPTPLEIAPARAQMVGLYSETPHEPSEMLALLDGMLIDASKSGDGQPLVQRHNQLGIARGRHQWFEMVETAIAQECISFRQQPALTLDGTLLHYELFSAIELPGEYCSASKFLPALEAMGKTAMFDRYVLTRAFERLSKPRSQPLAINISPYSLTDMGFIRWLKRTLNQQQPLGKKLLLEIPESAFFQQREEAMLACELITTAGFQFGIDGFGRHIYDINYLTELPAPAYVKLDHLYSQRLDDAQQQDLLVSLCRTARNLKLQIIATRIENSEQLRRFNELYVNGIQGFVSHSWEEAHQL
ncbi:bifunctional diguanylate cyclase/phosphodiesterase [Ferrimonas pelagia]|uniref:LapD/MoxY N-terminal periplasmic domain-containing protein n=1 Tax=Ferrimonas pelagia TaxID=1177826 RepID=A0ABP9ELU4_9GAMM